MTNTTQQNFDNLVDGTFDAWSKVSEANKVYQVKFQEHRTLRGEVNMAYVTRATARLALDFKSWDEKLASVAYDIVVDKMVVAEADMGDAHFAYTRAIQNAELAQAAMEHHECYARESSE